MKLKLTSILLAASAFAHMAQATVLEVSSWKGGGAEIANFPQIIEQFEKENPDIKIKLTFLSRPDSVTVLPARLQGGNPPDVMMIDREFMNIFAKQNQLMDLSGQSWIEKIKPEIRPYQQYDGKTYFMMLELSGIGLYSNMDQLNKAGISEVPVNKEQLLQACHKLSEKGITPMLMPASSGWTPGLFTVGVGLAGEGKPDAFRPQAFHQGQIKFAEDAYYIKAVEFMKEMINAKCFDPKLNAGIDPWSVGLATFQSGRAAMLPQGLWNIVNFDKDELPEDYQVGPLPALSGEYGVAMDILGPGWSIPKDSKNKEAAQKWIEFWAQDDVLKTFLKPESAVTTLVDGTSGVSDKAAAYLKAREAGYAVFTPEGLWAPNVVFEASHSMTSYMLDTTQSPQDILSRWDKIREKEAEE